MRVTKAIKEYIEKEVASRLEVRFADEKAEAERQSDMHEEFLENCAKAAENAFNNYMQEHFSEISDFCEITDARPTFYNSRAVVITDRCYNNSVHNWRKRFRELCSEKVNEIIVELELGGTKAELMEMLNRI